MSIWLVMLSLKAAWSCSSPLGHFGQDGVEGGLGLRRR